MKQIMQVTLTVENKVEISAVVNWLNGKVLGSRVIGVNLENMDLIFCGELSTYLGELSMISTEEISLEELDQLLRPVPHFIHELSVKKKK